jgi:hypothetical protein
MKPDFKWCAYRTPNLNLLPALLYTTMYTVNPYCPLFTRADWIKWGQRSYMEHRTVDSKIPHERGGFRLAFKFLNIHLGVEVRYEPRRTT